MLLDERLYKRAKAAAARASERYYEARRLWQLRGGRRGYVGVGGSKGSAAAEEEEEEEKGPLYNRHCGALLDQFVKTQMLSHFLSEGSWE